MDSTHDKMLDDEENDEDTCWVTLNLSADQNHKLELHLQDWKAPDIICEDPVDDLYDPQADALDEQWMTDTFGTDWHKTDGILSCAGCFTHVCFKCTRVRLRGGEIVYQATDEKACCARLDFSARGPRQRTLVDDTLVQYTPSTRKQRVEREGPPVSRSVDCPRVDRDKNSDDSTNNTTLPLLCPECHSTIGYYDPTRDVYVFTDVLAGRT